MKKKVLKEEKSFKENTFSSYLPYTESQIKYLIYAHRCNQQFLTILCLQLLSHFASNICDIFASVLFAKDDEELSINL